MILKYKESIFALKFKIFNRIMQRKTIVLNHKVFLSFYNCLSVLLVFGMRFYYSILVEIYDTFVEL